MTTPIRRFRSLDAAVAALNSYFNLEDDLRFGPIARVVGPYCYRVDLAGHLDVLNFRTRVGVFSFNLAVGDWYHNGDPLLPGVKSLKVRLAMADQAARHRLGAVA